MLARALDWSHKAGLICLQYTCGHIRILQNFTIVHLRDEGHVICGIICSFPMHLRDAAYIVSAGCICGMLFFCFVPSLLIPLFFTAACQVIEKYLDSVFDRMPCGKPPAPSSSASSDSDFEEVVVEPEPEGKAETDRAPARRIPGTTAKAKPATPAKAATPSSSTEEEEEPAIPGLPALPEPAGPDRRERRPISPERPPSTVSTGAREDHLPSLLGTRFQNE